METPNDKKYYNVSDGQACPNCHVICESPPNSFKYSWFTCDECGKEGCLDCFAFATCCEDCYNEEED